MAHVPLWWRNIPVPPPAAKPQPGEYHSPEEWIESSEILQRKLAQVSAQPEPAVDKREHGDVRALFKV